jgi:hypothetical protein
MRRKWVLVGASGAVVLGALFAGWWYLLRAPERHPAREAMLATACDSTQSLDARGEAVFWLFADYIPADSTSTAVRQVFDGCDWIDESFVERLDFLSGEPEPVRFRDNCTLFAVDLFAPDNGSQHRIYLHLSGYHRTPEDVRRFFGVKGEADATMRLTEYVLWNYRTGRVEVVDETGRHPPHYDP